MPIISLMLHLGSALHGCPFVGLTPLSAIQTAGAKSYDDLISIVSTYSTYSINNVRICYNNIIIIMFSFQELCILNTGYANMSRCES